jgi:hypothetical protein
MRTKGITGRRDRGAVRLHDADAMLRERFVAQRQVTRFELLAMSQDQAEAITLAERVASMVEGEALAAYEQQLRLARQWRKPGAQQTADALSARLADFEARRAA